MKMYLHIAPTLLISDIQHEFNKAFPFLKLEFFNNRSFSRPHFSSSQIIPGNKKIGDSQLGVKDDEIEIADEMKVIDLENLFKDKFKLAVQVFRKSGNLWLETTMTDNWTLQQQNNHGRELSTSKAAKDIPEDYDLNRDADH
jgi:hypothetical protein